MLIEHWICSHLLLLGAAQMNAVVVNTLSLHRSKIDRVGKSMFSLGNGNSLSEPEWTRVVKPSDRIVELSVPMERYETVAFIRRSMHRSIGLSNLLHDQRPCQDEWRDGNGKWDFVREIYRRIKSFEWSALNIVCFCCADSQKRSLCRHWGR